MIGAYVTNGKWIFGKGTRLTWNSFRSTFKSPLNLNEAVIDETTCANKRLRFVYVGRSILRFRQHISYKASLSTKNAQSVCSIDAEVVRIEL